MRWQSDPIHFSRFSPRLILLSKTIVSVFRHHYLLALSKSLVEVYYVETGELLQVISSVRSPRVLNPGSALESDVFVPGNEFGVLRDGPNRMGSWTGPGHTKLTLHGGGDDIIPMPVREVSGDVLVTGISGRGIEMLEL
jgi:hypothetical protein